MIVVVGSGLAGYSLIREFRKLDKTTPVTLITSDDGASYSKPMLSTGFAKDKTADQLVMSEAGKMAEQLNIDIRINTRVTGIEPSAHLITIGHEKLPYTQLVLAVGAEVRHVPMAGTGADAIRSVNDLTDYRILRAGLSEGQTVAILGAGLIGCEFANDFVLGGLKVHVIAPSETVLPLLVPSAVGHALEKGLTDAGVCFHLGQTATTVDRVGDGFELALSQGGRVSADRVLSAIGLKARTALAQAAGLEVRQGIVVDAFCQTSSPDIFALGDCAEVEGQNLQYVLPLMACAKALARTLAGQPEAVHFPVMPVVVKTPACPVVVVPAEGEGQWQIEGHTDELDIVARFLDAQGRLTGFALAGASVSQKQSMTHDVEASRHTN